MRLKKMWIPIVVLPIFIGASVANKRTTIEKVELEPKPIEYPSWILDSDGGYWKPPVDKPIGGLNQGMKYQWDESSVSWIQVPL